MIKFKYSKPKNICYKYYEYQPYMYDLENASFVKDGFIKSILLVKGI